MSLHLDTRQRAMLQEMGVHAWSPRSVPVTAASAPSTAAARTVPPTAVPAPTRTPRPAPSAPSARSAAPAQTIAASAAPAPTAPTRPANTALTWTLQAPQPLYPHAPPCTPTGTSHATPRWLLLTEGSADTDPLAGEAGALLDNMLHALRLRQQPQVFICVLTPQAPEASAGASGTADSADSANSAISADNTNNAAPCAAALAQAIAQVQPAVVLVMGRAAARSALGRSEPLGQLRALSHSTNGVPAVVTYDAAYLLRAPTAKAGAWDDLCRARALAAANQAKPVNG